jgi:hypothetical protein
LIPLNNERICNNHVVGQATNNGEEATNNGEEATNNGEEATNNGEEATNNGEETTNNGEETTNNGEEAILALIFFILRRVFISPSLHLSFPVYAIG